MILNFSRKPVFGSKRRAAAIRKLIQLGERDNRAKSEFSDTFNLGIFHCCMAISTLFSVFIQSAALARYGFQGKRAVIIA